MFSHHHVRQNPMKSFFHPLLRKDIEFTLVFTLTSVFFQDLEHFIVYADVYSHKHIPLYRLQHV